MDQATLVEVQIQDGKRLIDRLLEEAVPVTVAAWIKEGDGGMWYLYLATPLVTEEEGKKPAYGRVNEVIRRMPAPFWVDSFDIKVISPKHRIAQAIADVNRRQAWSSALRSGLAGGLGGGVSIESAYVYPSISPAANAWSSANE
jgi:hypothetical protein